MVIKILVLFGTMFLLMMIGSPIAVALGVATMVTMTATTNISLTTMSTACLSGLDSFPLMAIPFFMLAGNLMKSGGISRRILDFADAVVGWVTGSVGMPIQYNKDKSENPRKIKGFRDLSLFFFRLFFLKIRLCEVSRKGQCYINDKIISTGNGGMNGKQKTDCLQRNYRCL